MPPGLLSTYSPFSIYLQISAEGINFLLNELFLINCESAAELLTANSSSITRCFSINPALSVNYTFKEFFVSDGKICMAQ